MAGFLTTHEDGKFRRKHRVNATDELVVAFDRNGRFMRIDTFWQLHDYKTGVDALIEPLHKAGLDRLIANYKFNQSRHGEGFKLHIIGVASTFKKDIRYDNDALAKRRARTVVSYLVSHGVNEEDIAAPQHVVKGDPKFNEENDRSVLISTGHPVSSEFSMTYAGQDGLKVDLVTIRDESWGLETTFRAARQSGKMDLSRAVPPRGSRKLTILTGVGGAASGLQSKVSLFSFNPSIMKFAVRASVSKVSGVTFLEGVPFDGTGTAAEDRAVASRPAALAVSGRTSRVGSPMIGDGPLPAPLDPDDEMTALMMMSNGRVVKAA